LSAHDRVSPMEQFIPDLLSCSLAVDVLEADGSRRSHVTPIVGFHAEIPVLAFWVDESGFSIACLVSWSRWRINDRRVTQRARSAGV